MNGQEVRLDFRNYSTAEGLPSSETYFVLQSRDGLMWFATDNGVASFDGYAFTVYNADDGLDDTVIFTLFEDKKGRIWAGGLSGRVFYFEEGRFWPYQFNNVLKGKRRQDQIMYLVEVRSDGTLVYHMENRGMFSVSPTGRVTPIMEAKDPYLLLYEVEAGNANAALRRHAFISTIRRETFTIRKGSDTTQHFFSLQRPLPSKMLSRGAIAAYREDAAYLIPNDTLYLFTADKTFKYPLGEQDFFNLYVDAEGVINLCSDRGGGLVRARLSADSTDLIWNVSLAGHSISMMAYDRRGGLWVTTLNAGVFYTADPRQIIYTATSNGTRQKAITLEHTDTDHFFASHGNGTLYLFDKKQRRGRKIEIPDLNNHSTYAATDLYFLRDRRRLLYHYGFLDAGEGEGWQYHQYDNPRINRDVMVITRYEAVGDTIRYATNFDLGTLNAANGRMNSYFENRDVPQSKYYDIADYSVLDDGRVIVGTLGGVMELFPEGQFLPAELDVETARERIVDIVNYGSNRMVFGTRGKGVTVMLPDTSYNITVAGAGLASDMVRRLYRHEHDVYVCTLEGLSRISFTEDLRDYHVRTFTQASGLVSNEIHGMDIHDGEVWLATTEGVVQFFESPLDTMRAPPVIDGWFFPGLGDTLLRGTSLYVAPKRRNFTLQYRAVDFRMNGRINYRYRLTADGAWTTTNNLRASFTGLPPGNYTFEVQRQNADRVWSRSATLPITVGVHWYNTWWARTLMLVGALSLIAWILIRRERLKRKEQEFLLQINRLEHEALHAQMNPHFVFNALNSIQKFVLHNETREAATYLAKFAGVIRQTLRSSVEGTHSLDAELEMLRVYLELEKLRFKERFDYSITIDSHLVQDRIKLPPLLIQPFVENAILHGMKGRKEDGRIQVHFGGNEAQLEVTVTDNGSGYDPLTPKSSDSLGMTITRKRLLMMSNKRRAAEVLSVKPLRGAGGDMVGTRVVLRIRTTRPTEAKSTTTKSRATSPQS